MDFIDNLHNVSRPDTHWSRTNAAEALPGVQTPLSWDFWELTGERAKRGALYDVGFLQEHELKEPDEISERVWAIFYGRVTLNADFFQKVHSRSSKADAAAFARQVLGDDKKEADVLANDDTVSSVNAQRAAAHELFLENFWRTETPSIQQWWRENTRVERLKDREGACRHWLEAQTRFERLSRLGAATASLAFQTYGALRGFCQTIGVPELETRLTAGLGDTHDIKLLKDLWSVSREALSLEAFAEEHGYNGPGAGVLSSRVWREDLESLRPLVSTYATLPDNRAPHLSAVEKGETRKIAEADFFTAARARREQAQTLLERAQRFTRMRELGRVMFLHAIDVARAASRTRGADLASRGLIDDPEDVFFLLRPEVIEDAPPADAKDRIAFRKARVAEYRSFEIPETWRGNPQPLYAQGESDAPVKGLGVAAGRVEGVVRVVVDPMEEEPLESGEILVCSTTDPSWGAFFFAAGGLVIDIGGPMSHGAIIAREIGVPCVINTLNGSKRLKTGDRVVIDGDKGTVEYVLRV